MLRGTRSHTPSSVGQWRDEPTKADTSPSMSPSSNLLTKQQAADYLGIAPRTLDDWRAAQAIPCIERPGFVRFLLADLEAFLAKHRIEARTTTTFKRRKSRHQSTTATK